MKFLTLILLLFTELSISAQIFSYKKLSESFDREEFDITSSVPFKGGLLSVVMDKKSSFNAKYSIKVCNISKDLKLQKDINIGFEAEPNLELIGIFRIAENPIIFYSSYLPEKELLYIKAIILNKETLQIEKIKEIKKLYQDRTFFGRIIIRQPDAEWRSLIKITESQDSSKFFLSYIPRISSITPNTKRNEVYFAIIDANANLITDKIENYPKTISDIQFMDFAYSKNGKIYSLFSVYQDRHKINNSSAYLRTIDLSNGQSKDFDIEKNIGTIRNANLLFRNEKNIEIIGIYSDNSNVNEFSGACHLQFNSETEVIKTVVRKELPYDFKLADIYPEYGYEAPTSKDYYKLPFYERFNTIYAGYKANGNIDLSIEYAAVTPDKPYIINNDIKTYRLSVINFTFSGNTAFITLLEKKQIEKRDANNVCGIKVLSHGNKLIYLFNDSPGNLDLEIKPKPFEPLTKDDCSLVAAIIDEKGNLSKEEITAVFPKKHYPEPVHAVLLDKKTLIMRVSNPVTRHKKSDIAFVTIE